MRTIRLILGMPIILLGAGISLLGLCLVGEIANDAADEMIEKAAARERGISARA